MSILDHQELVLVKGVGKTPGDTVSAEQNLVVVDLLDTNSGFSLIEWSPNIPSLKGGGTWADSPIDDGRTLLAGKNTNVTETIIIQLTGSTYPVFAAKFAALQRMIQDAREFWDTFDQIEPVYIQWWAVGAPGRQYALIYNIDVNVEWQDSTQAQAEITLSVEREFGWRGIAPGANPKEWSLRGTTYPLTSLALTNNSGHLVQETITNAQERNVSGNVFSAENYLSIPAASIPGDLEALVQLGIDNSGYKYFIARDTRPVTLGATDGGTSQIRVLEFPAEEASLGTDAARTIDTGAIAYVGNRRRITVTFVTTADTLRANWGSNVDVNIMRGRYMIFARVRQYNGAQNDLRYHVDIRDSNGAIDNFVSPSTIPTLTGGSGNTSAWGLDYLGVINIPSTSRALPQSAGKRMLVSGYGLGTNTILIRLYASRVSGTTAILAIGSVLFVPIDEYACGVIDPAASTGVVGQDYLFLDNTGYFGHGDNSEIAQTRNIAGGVDRYQSCELRGQIPKLKPGVDNRLLFLAAVNPSYLSDALLTFSARLNIVPRWSGIRDA